MSEINVTPFVDVMLVLLDNLYGDGAETDGKGVPVMLPATIASRRWGQNREPLSVTIAKDGKIYLQKQVVPQDELVP